MKKNKAIHTEDLKTGTILRFYKPSFGYGIFTIAENLQRFMIVRSGIDEAPFLTHGDILDIYLWLEKSGAWEWESRVLGKISDDEHFIVLSHPKTAEWRNERKCIAAKVDLPFRFFAFHQTDEKRIFESASLRPSYAKIKELTDRFAVIESPEAVHGPVIKGHITLNGRDIEITGIVTNEGNGRTTVAFSGMSDKTRMEILDYIYRSYRE